MENQRLGFSEALLNLSPSANKTRKSAKFKQILKQKNQQKKG